MKLQENFYLSAGFEAVKKIENYYTDVEPRGAYYLRFKLHDAQQDKSK